MIDTLVNVLDPIAHLSPRCDYQDHPIYGSCSICRVAPGHATGSKAQFVFELVSCWRAGHPHRVFMYAFTAISI